MSNFDCCVFNSNLYPQIFSYFISISVMSSFSLQNQSQSAPFPQLWLAHRQFFTLSQPHQQPFYVIRTLQAKLKKKSYYSIDHGIFLSTCKCCPIRYHYCSKICFCYFACKWVVTFSTITGCEKFDSLALQLLPPLYWWIITSHCPLSTSFHVSVHLLN